MKHSKKWFIEIGVGGSNTLYNLLNNGWYGIMIDANPRCFQNIEEHPKLYKEICAIAPKNGRQNFLLVENIKRFEEPIAVLGMSGLEDGPTPLHDSTYNGHRFSVEVSTKRLDTIIQKYHLTEIEFLKIDVEGYDVPILLDYSFVIKPKMIKFEHIHYSGKVYDASANGFDQVKMTEDYYLLLEKLKDLGYVVWEENEDVYCIL
jgi:FkbM family methyltransferase